MTDRSHDYEHPILNPKSMNLKKYPHWVCWDCAFKAKKGKMEDGVATFHLGKCEVCEQETSVTESRDFGYCHFEGHEDYKSDNPLIDYI